MAALPGASCRDHVSSVLMSMQIQNKRHPKRFSVAPLGGSAVPCVPAWAARERICLLEELKRRMQWRCIITFS